MTFHGIVQDGKVVWNDPAGAMKHTRSLEGQQVSVKIEKRRFGRSLEQNAYYWGVVIREISEHTGFEPEEMHEILKHMFLLTEKAGRTFARSTSTLNTAEMAQYLDRCIRWAATELSVAIPEAA